MDLLSIPNWFIVYTKPCNEKRVTDILFKKKIDYYFPLKRSKRQFPNGIKTISEPIFPSYVFVLTTPAHHSQIRGIKGVISIVHWLAKPAIIQKEEIDAIKTFLNFHMDVEIEKIPVCIKKSPSIFHSPIRIGKSIPEMNNDVLKIQLPSLGFVLKANLHQEFITKANIMPSENVQPSFMKNLHFNQNSKEKKNGLRAT